jgi:hypothetical protein
MSRIATSYENTIIYKICCKDPNITDEYIGHTKNLIHRRYQHKFNCNNEKNKDYNLKLYQYIRKNGGWDNWTLVQIEQCNCKNVNEAKSRERYFIELLKPSLNCDIPNRTQKEYLIDNKEEIAEKQKIYRESNKEKIAEKNKIYRESNKEKLAEKDKIKYEKNKEKIAEKAKEKITCECGCEISKKGLARHRKTKRHLDKLNLNSLHILE